MYKISAPKLFITREDIIMKKKTIVIWGIIATLSMNVPLTVFAENTEQGDLKVCEQDEFANMINEIESIKCAHPEYTEDEILNLMDEMHAEKFRGILDIWNSLTASEKKLCIRYPFDALKVNKAKNIATDQTLKKFNENGLGNRSDAFRHGIWNAEMTVLIGKEKAELFATAHEDKDISGNESDGYPKTAHRDMDLNNNAVGRNIGEKNMNVSENEMADIIYRNIHSESTEFVWLHE